MKDDRDALLAWEEQRSLLIELNGSVERLNKSLIDKLGESKTTPVIGEVSVTNPVDTVNVANLDELQYSIKEFADALATAIEQNRPEAVKELVVSNIDQAKAESISVTNFRELAASLKGYFDDLEVAVRESTPVIKNEQVVIEWPTDPRKPVAVRLSNGKEFYNAIAGAVSSGIAVFKSNGRGVQVELDADGNVPVMPMNGLLPMKWDDLQFSNADANGNYQTGTVYSDAVQVAELEFTYDGSSNLTRIRRL